MHVLVAGPSLRAISGVSTHVNLLLVAPWSDVSDDALTLTHFQVGSEGRNEGPAGRIARLLLSPWQLAACLVARRIDILHLNTSLDPKPYWRDAAYLGVARLLGRRVVLQIHGGRLPHELFAGRPWSAGLLRRVLRAADTVVALGQQEWRALRDFAPQARVELIPHAVAAVPAEAMAARSMAASELQLLFLGRLDAAKGLYELVDAVDLLVRGGRQMRLVIAGEGPEEAGLRSRIADLKLQPRVELTGARFGVDKQTLLSQAHVFVLPSYREGLPYALLEAMAAGMAPVVSSVGAVPDVVGYGEHGLLVAPRNIGQLVYALARLYDDRGLLARLGAAARARIAERYGLERFARSFARVYRQAGRPSRRRGDKPAIGPTASDPRV
jgi:glycosyltransferase involved in cell wall biosynthesis